MVKKMICIGMLLVMALSFAACGNENVLQDKIDELQKKIEQLQDDVNELGNENENLKDRVEELETENQALTDQILELEKKLKRMEDITGIIIDSWEGSDILGVEWYNQVEITLTFPRKIRQGEPFLIKVTTTNISDYDVEYESSSTFANMGALLLIRYQSDYDYVLGPHYIIVHDDIVKTVIHNGESIEHVWEFDGKAGKEIAQKGIYDIYLTNGEVIRNAIEIL